MNCGINKVIDFILYSSSWRIGEASMCNTHKISVDEMKLDINTLVTDTGNTLVTDTGNRHW